MLTFYIKSDSIILCIEKNKNVKIYTGKILQKSYGGVNIKTKSRKLLILGTVFFMLMSISGIYAVSTQILDSEFGVGGVRLEIKTYTLNEQNEEEEYADGTKKVMPGDIISFIPKIKITEDKCYLRIKLYYINDQIEASEYVSGMSDKWEKHGEYYYYNYDLNRGEIVKVFDSIKIPENIDKMINNKDVKFTISAEAIQERNFTPNYELEDPWNGITPTKNNSVSYNIDAKSSSNITIDYVGDAEEDVKVPNSFFSSIKRIMPGDSYTSSIEINNKDKEKARYYLTLGADESDKQVIELLKKLDLIITNKNGVIIYNGKMISDEKIFLGEYGLNGYDKLEFKIIVPEDLKNEYVNLKPKLNWKFSVEYDKNDKKVVSNPKTGDKINIAIAVFLVSAIGLLTVILINYRRNKEEL